jgi:hypothetical protein
MVLGDMEDDRACLEQGEIAFLIGRNLAERMKCQMRACVNELRPTLLTNVGSPWLQWPRTPEAARPSQPARPLGAVQKAARRPCRVANTLIMGRLHLV